MSDKNINAGRPAKKFSLTKREKLGTYTFVITLIFLAVLVIVNLLVSALPKSFLLIDTSANKLYAISDGTEDFVGEIGEEVTINWICQNGEEDAMLSAFLKKYADLNGRFKLKILDPIKDPSVLDKYIGSTDASPSNFSLIVESGKRFRVIGYETLFYYYNQYLSENYGLSEPIPYDYYVYLNGSPNYYFSMAEYYGYATETYFWGDDTLTKAVEYVTLEKIPHVYIVEGHGEENFSGTMLSFLSDNNVEYESLRLASSDSVPSDASCLVLYAPGNDLSSSEAGMMRDYLDNGGNLLLISSPENVGMPNLMGLFEPYGVSAVPGIVYDENTSYYKTTQYTLKPDVNPDHDITYYPSSNKLQMTMPESHGIRVSDSATAVTALLTTSDSAYSKVGEERSEAGKLALGVAITAETSGGAAQIVWYSSALAFTDQTVQANDYGNYYYLFYSLFWMNETYDSALSDVVGIPTTEPLLDGLTQTSVYIWAAAFTVIIPVTVIIAGLVVWIRRRRR